MMPDSDSTPDKMALADLEKADLDTGPEFGEPGFADAPAPVGAVGMEPSGVPETYIAPASSPGPATQLREAAFNRKRRARLNVIALIWAVTALLLVVAFAVALLNRQTLAERVGGAGALFAAVGVETSRTGFVLDGAGAEYASPDALEVSFSVRNISGESREVPPVRVALLDASGAEVDRRETRIGVMPPNAEPAFGSSWQVEFSDPPESVRASVSLAVPSAE